MNYLPVKPAHDEFSRAVPTDVEKQKGGDNAPYSSDLTDHLRSSNGNSAGVRFQLKSPTNRNMTYGEYRDKTVLSTAEAPSPSGLPKGKISRPVLPA